MNKFTSAFYQAQTDKGYTHNYDKWYEVIFKDYEPETLLEIGVMSGRSLAAWKMAFPKCAISGLDITDDRFDQRYIDIAEANITIASSTDSSIRDIVTDTYDAIIDDGSHFYKDIIETWKNFHDKFNYAYIIEDVMYEKQTIIDVIKQYGYDNIKVYPSAVKNVPVNAGFLKDGKHGDINEIIRINLYMIVVFKD